MSKKGVHSGYVSISRPFDRSKMSREAKDNLDKIENSFMQTITETLKRWEEERKKAH